MRSGAGCNNRRNPIGAERWRLAVIALLLHAPIVSLTAQDTLRQRILVGGMAGYEVGWELGRFPVFAGSPECGEFTSGSASSLFGGIGFSYGSLFSERLGIAMRLSWGEAEGAFIAEPHEPLVIVDTARGLLPQVQHEYRFNSTWEMGRADLLLDYRPLDRLSLRPGVWLGIRRSAQLTQSDNIVNEPLYRFDAGATERPMLGGEQLTVTSLALGFSGSITYHLRMTPWLWLAPELSFHGEVTSVASNAAWRTLTAGGGIGVMFDLTPREPAPPPPAQPLADTSSNPPPAPPRASLRASLDLYGIDESGARLPSATIRINEVLHRVRAPLLGPIYFDRGSSELPARYVRYRRDDADRFSVDSLADLDLDALHAHALNLLGVRMRDYPDATINLIGYRSAGEPVALAGERAHHVRRYLHETWGIDTTRIVVIARTGAARGRTEEGRSETRKVQITSTASAIAEPMIIDRMARSFDPPLIALDPMIDSSATIREWTIVLSYDGKEVGRYASGDTANEESSSVQWQIPDNRSDMAHSFLVAEFTVQDSSGSQVSSRTQTPLTFERTFRIVEMIGEGARERVHYSLLPFAHNAVTLDNRNQQVVREIADDIRVGARVIVAGNSERTTGSSDGLSHRRAEIVAASLRGLLREQGVRNVTIAVRGDAHDAMRFDDLPEGRLPAREVEVLIEQDATRQSGSE